MNTHKAVLGLDTAQAGVSYQFNDTNNNPLARGKAAASQAGIDRLNAERKLLKLEWSELLVCVEATGIWHLHWSEKLHRLGARVYVLNPLIAKRTSSLPNAIRDNKSDPVDAVSLAELLVREHQRLERFRYQGMEKRFTLQRQQSARQALRANLTNLKKSLGTQRSLVFPELHELGFSDKTERAVMMAAPTPARVLALSEAELKGLAGKNAARLRESAAQSFADPALSEAAAGALQMLAQTVGQLEKDLEAFDESIEQEAQKCFGSAMLEAARQVPGFGQRTTVMILASISPGLLEAPMSRRKKANKIQAQCGCEPRLRQSGKNAGTLRLSKRGSSYGRTALYQAAICAIKNDPGLKCDYKAKRMRGKPHKVAIYDIGRRLIRRMVAHLSMLPQTQPPSNLSQPACSP